MDRRDALKKLGVGGAVAVAGPVLLDSFNVASASSTQLPPADINIISSVVNLQSDGVQIALATSQFPANTQYAWIVFSGGGNNVSVAPTNANGSTVVVDRPGNNAPSPFTVRMTATSAGATPNSRSYFIAWSGGTIVTVSP
jgi:hypothetical protein